LRHTISQVWHKKLANLPYFGAAGTLKAGTIVPAPHAGYLFAASLRVSTRFRDF
jgi:hypothetical protein